MDISVPEHLKFKLSKPVRFLVFAGSLRMDSLNSKLAALTARMVEKHGGEVDLAKMEEFDAPSYNQDIQGLGGFPPGAEEFHRRLEANDAFIIISPEYNASRSEERRVGKECRSRWSPYH